MLNCKGNEIMVGHNYLTNDDRFAGSLIFINFAWIILKQLQYWKKQISSFRNIFLKFDLDLCVDRWGIWWGILLYYSVIIYENGDQNANVLSLVDAVYRGVLCPEEPPWNMILGPFGHLQFFCRLCHWLAGWLILDR